MESKGTIKQDNIPRYEEQDGHQVGQGSSLGAYFNILNALAGVGTLGLGSTLGKAGWLMLIVIVLAAAFSIYTGTLLVKCMSNKKFKMETYPDVGMATFGVVGRTIVQFCQYTIISGGVTMYMVYAGTQAYNLAKHNDAGVAKWAFMLGAGFIIWVPLVSLKTVREVAWISALGGLATLLAVIISVALCFSEMPSLPPAKYDVFKFSDFPHGMAIISFAYGGTMIFPHVYRSMAKPQQWNGTVSLAILTATAMYLIMSIVGYATFGRETKNPIFDNLQPSTPKWIASLFLAAHVLCAGTVFLCSLCLEIERYFTVTVERLGKVKEFGIRAVIRTAVLAALVTIGCLIDEFELLMDLVGAFSECMLVFIVPTVCHIKMYGIRGRAYWEYPVIVITLVAATLCVVVGTKGAIVNIANHISKKH